MFNLFNRQCKHKWFPYKQFEAKHDSDITLYNTGTTMERRATETTQYTTLVNRCAFCGELKELRVMGLEK